MAVRSRDVRGLAWWVVEEVVRGGVAGREASALCSLIRVLASLGPGEGEEGSLLEVELRGLVMNGLPPRSDAEWALAERVFGAEGVAELRREYSEER